MLHRSRPNWRRHHGPDGGGRGWLSDITHDIAAATQHRREYTDHVGPTIAQLFEVTRHIAALGEEAAAVPESMARRARMLAAVVVLLCRAASIDTPKAGA